jgi:outer membrane protein assembly factor BamB
MCLDRNTGKVLWERVAKTATPHEGYHRRYGSFASNSPVTDGKLVYAFFGSRGLYAYDLDGNPKWQKDFRPMKMRLQFGEGTAPTLHDNYLILGFDQEEDSYVVTLDKSTGKELWRMSRDEASAWAQPLVVTVGGSKQVVVSATNRVRSYDLQTGKLIWECSGLEGDLTGTDSILWQNQRGNSYSASPVLHDNKLYMVTDNGMVSCLNAATGEPYYIQQRLPKTYNFKSSPVAVNGKLYLATENDDVVVLRMGEKYEVLATNTFPDQMFISSPAVAGGSLYLRSQDTLYCIRQ